MTLLSIQGFDTVSFVSLSTSFDTLVYIIRVQNMTQLCILAVCCQYNDIDLLFILAVNNRVFPQYWMKKILSL